MTQKEREQVKITDTNIQKSAFITSPFITGHEIYANWFLEEKIAVDKNPLFFFNYLYIYFSFHINIRKKWAKCPKVQKSLILKAFFVAKNFLKVAKNPLFCPNFHFLVLKIFQNPEKSVQWPKKCPQIFVLICFKT